MIIRQVDLHLMELMMKKSVIEKKYFKNQGRKSDDNKRKAWEADLDAGDDIVLKRLVL